jgi:hypothetical protein
MMISYGVLIECQPDGAGDEDTYRFSGKAGDRIFLTLATQETDKEDRRPRAEVRGPDGAPISTLEPGFGRGTELLLRLTQTGVHTIIVEEDGRNARVLYHLGLMRLVAPPPEAPLLGVGSGGVEADDVTGQISTLGGVDVFTFEAIAGARIEVHLRDDNDLGLARPVALIYDRRGTRRLLLQPVNERLISEFDVVRTGPHVVIVYEHSHNHTVDYRIRANCLGGSDVCTPIVSAPTCNGLEATIVGSDDDNIIEGTPEDDVIVGLDGNDVIYGGSGNDTICGGPGDDIIDGNGGNDVLLGDDGNNVLNGGPGNDRLIGNGGNNILIGGVGRDRLIGGDNADICNGNSGTDTDTNCEIVFHIP